MFNVEHLVQVAEARGLVYPHCAVRTANDLAGKFRFETNLFGGYTSRDPADVLALIQLIRDTYADGDEEWVHEAMLGQVAKRADLGSPFTAWTRSYVVGRDPGNEWITLKQWLEDNGHPYRSN